MCRRKAEAYETIVIGDDIRMSRDRDRQEVGMLVLSRKQSQQIVIGPDIRITIVKLERNQVRLGIEAPRGITVLREELTARGAGVDGTATCRERTAASSRQFNAPASSGASTTP